MYLNVFSDAERSTSIIKAKVLSQDICRLTVYNENLVICWHNTR